MSDQGDRIAEEAVKHLEIGGGPNQSLENRQAYKALCWPFDPAWAQDDFSKNQYSCALTARGIWRNVGVQHPLLEGAYVEQYTQPLGDAVSQIQVIAKSKGAWVDPRTSDEPPYRGCVVIICTPGQNDAHVLIVYNYTGIDGVLTSVDGGQGVRGDYSIQWRRRRLGYDHAHKLWRVWEGPNLDVPARPVLGWAIPEKMLP